MHRPSLRVIVVVLGLSIAATSCHQSSFFQKIAAEPSDAATGEAVAAAPSVDYCDLTATPQDFDGKWVRVRARFATFYEGVYLAATACDDRHTSVEFDDAFQRISTEAALKQFKRAMHSPESEPIVTFVGRFAGPGYYGHQNMFHFQWRVVAITAVGEAAMSHYRHVVRRWPPNHRLDPAHSGVTALAQGRTRRATGRAGQAERYTS